MTSGDPFADMETTRDHPHLGELRHIDLYLPG